MIRILLVEQMSLLRGAVAAVLSAEDDLEVVAQLARLEEMLPIAGTVQPDVAVIDIDLFADNAPTVVPKFTEAMPDCAVLVLADADKLGALHGALDMYVRGFIGKDTAPSELVEHIRRVAKGERVIDSTLAVAAVWASRNPLTPREREVLRVAASGVPSTEIADLLHLSVGTVRNYLSVVLRKTGGRNRLEAVRIAEDAGWL